MLVRGIPEILLKVHGAIHDTAIVLAGGNQYQGPISEQKIPGILWMNRDRLRGGLFMAIGGGRFLRGSHTSRQQKQQTCGKSVYWQTGALGLAHHFDSAFVV